MPRWTDDALRWYAAAARASDYHAGLARACAPWLGRTDDACELGCGPGFLAVALAGLVRRVTAVDSDPACAAFGEAMAREAGAAAVTFETGDAFALPASRRWDAVVSCLFGDPAADPGFGLRLASRVALHVVHAVPRPLLPGGSGRRKTYAADVEASLLRRGIPFERRDLVLGFGQPLRDREDARAFVRHWSGGRLGEEAVEAFLDERLETRNGAPFLPHEKPLSLFVLRRG